MLSNFTQSKHINGLSRPLISKGLIWMSPAGQLVWQTQMPIKSTLVITESGIKFFNKQDELLPDNNYPLANKISGLFLSILGGDVKKLEASFVQNLNCEKKRWQLDLEPKNKSLSGIIKVISLSGNDDIESIGFQEQRGDRTVIELVRQESTTRVKLERYLEH